MRIAAWSSMLGVVVLGCGDAAPAVTPQQPVMSSGVAGAPVAPAGGAGRSAPVGPTAAAGSGPAVASAAGRGAAGMVSPMMALAGTSAVAGSGAAGALAAAGSGAAPAAGAPAAGTGAAGASGAAGAAGSGAGPGTLMPGSCCKDGKCICRGEVPTALTADNGPYKTMSYSIQGVGCVYYPTDAEPPFSAVTISDGFGGSGGCGPTQTNQWGPLYASHGIVAMIVETGSGDQPNARGKALTDGVAAFKAENTKMGSPLFGKLAGRYGTSGFSMGGGGTTYASQSDTTLLSSVAIMPWGPVRSGVEVPTLVICGSSDTVAPCSSHGIPAYAGIPDSVPKMRVEVPSGHAGQPSSGMRASGKYGLAFEKAFLDGDERWLPLLKAADSEETTIK